MSLRSLLLGSSRFGHFAGMGPAAAITAAAPAEDDEAAKAAAAKAEDDEEAAASAAAKAEEDDGEMKKARKARRARKAKAKDKESDDEDSDAEDAANDDEDDDDEEDMKKAAAAGHDIALDAAFRTGARAQRRRASAILAHPAAAANPLLAMTLAFETNLTAKKAIAVLDRTPAPSRSTLADRMAASDAGKVKAGPSMAEAPKGPAAIAASWDRAMSDFVPAK